MLVPLSRKLVHSRLRQLLGEGTGRIVINYQGQCELDAGSGDETGVVEIKDPRAYIAFMQGNTPSGRAYMKGMWDSPDLAQLMKILASNLRSYNEVMEKGLRWKLNNLLSKLSFLARESRSGTRDNISRHYDLGNDMFGKFLDQERVYSCAIFSEGSDDLDEAQRNKLDTLCRKCGVQENDRMLDLGCGWGGLSIWAARNYGANVVALTLSKEQYEFVKQRVEREGLADKVRPVLQDYRDFDPGEGFDRLISVEMIEAVGPHNFGAYFQRVKEMLKKGGRAVIQAITVPEERFNEALHDIDFVKEYIFPGGACPSKQLMRELPAQAGLVPGEVEDITEHYVTTLALWRKNFVANMDAIVKLGYDRDFCRMMTYYFSYCEAGFATRQTEDIQAVYDLPA